MQENSFGGDAFENNRSVSLKGEVNGNALTPEIWRWLEGLDAGSDDFQCDCWIGYRGPGGGWRGNRYRPSNNVDRVASAKLKAVGSECGQLEGVGGFRFKGRDKILGPVSCQQTVKLPSILENPVERREKTVVVPGETDFVILLEPCG
ncbi:MAG: hypothetical protein A2951_01360 [Candidatus Buchananbacteria bacterium RIFCSPLOWO2_01_FULL_56_15]|uniref:Uncharacterized protein n=2 Tax=Candidatus Buchananiibacteriota TaxID=1817903 RepID=A0A1G1YHV4_9BACT|nr:MAG: hypothetical protein A3J59_01650 [Candidatus Buchananbacteria bacterium RIFCSPHIGHO2_02_FULL_56_16]OGY54607.1 MAG: hypothetical protein A2951_01360 [Candidatus Buchananbacteria bacterium RIFCSPLOWO2_01_FULL_56_15]